MGRFDKLLLSVITGTSDANISFISLCGLLIKYNFDERIKGDHHIFTREDVVEIINLQPVGDKAKAYQVKQVRNIFHKYKIGNGNE